MAGIRVWLSSEGFGGEAREDVNDLVALLLGVMGVSASIVVFFDFFVFLGRK